MPCPLDVGRVLVRTLSVEHLEVSWTVADTIVDVLDFEFRVLRSEAVEGPFESVSAWFEDRYLFIDNVVKTQNRYRQHHYKVQVRRKSDQEVWDFGPVQLGQEVDLVSGELRRHIGLLMQEFIGELCWVLPVRTFGQRCSCWNAELQRVTRSNCRTCYNTAFTRGYMWPVESWISVDPAPHAEQVTQLGKQQQTNTTARMAWYPPVKPGDLIVNGATNSRWKVVQVSSTRHVGTPVHQEVQLHEVPIGSAEYLIPVDPGCALRNIVYKPSRNFTNPQHLESDDGLDAAFSLYDACRRKPCE